MVINQDEYENMEKKKKEYDETMKMYEYLEDFNPQTVWPDIIARVTLCSFYIKILLSNTEH